MKRVFTILAVLLVASLFGCAKKTEQASTTGSDSLLATNPVEQPQGNISPSQQFQGGTTQQPPQAEAPKPAETPKPKPRKTTSQAPAQAPARPSVTVPAGTGVDVTVNAKITSETAQPGDAWSGVVKDPVVIGTSAPIPAGSTVNGVVEAVKPAKKGDRALLILAIRSITVNGKDIPISASSDSMVAGSTRARNVGTVAGGAAAGALIGKAIGGGKGAVIGGLLGAGAATGAVASTKGYQVTVDEGSAIKFHVTQSVAIRD